MDEELTEFKAFMARREYKMIRKRMRRGLMQTIEAGATFRTRHTDTER
jgi:DNA invertase Pin-like site-specific DNA recombinase